MSNQKFFKAFFALKPGAIQETVILSPVVYPKQFERVTGEKGKHYKSILGYLVANFKNTTFVKTPMTQAAVSDAVLLLSKTGCKKTVFIGAIGGLARGLKIGDVVATNKPRHVYSVRSIHEETRKKLLYLRKKGIVGIDFESRAFFAAARKAKLAARAFYVVTDLPLTKPFYIKKTKREKHKIKFALEESIKISSKK
ncbi:MAG: hypothetical protein V3T21_01900 [Candidatus Margulisiibacteriota bacterium]